jgi:membrane-associated phospholipid phosphatase
MIQRRLLLLLLLFLMPLTIVPQHKDIDILKEINLNRNRQLDPLFIAITHSTGPLTFGLPLVLLGIALVRKNKKLRFQAYYIIGSVLTAVVITNILKYTINRPRPFVTYSFIEKVTSGGSPSFPSGHTSDAFVLAMALSLAFPRSWVIIPSFLWAFLMGYTRMGLGVHYPADVLVGALIGIASALLIYFFTRNKFYHHAR